MKIKICGITNHEDAVMCATEGADALGFIFFEKSPRYIDPEKADDIIKRVPPFVMTIGVFVDVPTETVNETAGKLRLHAVQLHGDESPAYVDMIKYPVIKAFRVDDGFDFRQLRAYSNHGILLDAYSGAAYGGTGKTFAWQVIPDEIRQSCIIAGGISSKNICEVIEQVNPAGVDLSSSVESEPGKKDPVKVKNFFRQLRSCRISSNYHGDKRKNTDYYGSA